MAKIIVQNTEITVLSHNDKDYISLTDMANGKQDESRAADVIKNWIRTRYTIEFLGTWEMIHNPNFKVVEFDHFRMQAGLPNFTLSASEWSETEKQKTFVHNDVRDRICDIGFFLGFKAYREKKVADGAVVDAIWEVSVGNMGRVTYVFEVQTNGSIDSLLMNLMRAKNNPSVQGIVAVSDAKQIEKIKKEAASVKAIRDDLKYWDYNDVLKVYDSLSSAYESINKLHLVPEGYNIL